MTPPLKAHQRRPSTLTRPKAPAFQWDAPMMRALEECVYADMPVKATAQHLGIGDSTLCRGALLRLRQLLPPRAG